MSEFLDMGGYAPYVWSAYGITLLVLLVNVWSARRARLRPLKRAAASLDEARPRPRPTVREVQ
jgi:heme exporter protein D